MSPEDLDSFADLLKGGLEQAPVGDDQRKRINKDLTQVVKDMKAGLPEVGAMVAFSFTTERGQESYAYDYSPAGAASAGPDAPEPSRRRPDPGRGRPRAIPAGPVQGLRQVDQDFPRAS